MVAGTVSSPRLPMFWIRPHPAAPMEISPSSPGKPHLIVFKVAPYTFCAPAVEVGRIVAMPPMSPLPKAPPSIIGVIQHHGHVYRVLSLRRKLGLENGPPRLEGQLILTRLPSGNCAFLVDEVLEILPERLFTQHRLKPDGPIDLFEAFVVCGAQILLKTRFELIERADDTPFPSPDLGSLHQAATEVGRRRKPLQRPAEAGDAVSRAGEQPAGAHGGGRPPTRRLNQRHQRRIGRLKPSRNRQDRQNAWQAATKKPLLHHPCPGKPANMTCRASPREPIEPAVSPGLCRPQCCCFW